MFQDYWRRRRNIPRHNLPPSRDISLVTPPCQDGWPACCCFAQQCSGPGVGGRRVQSSPLRMFQHLEEKRPGLRKRDRWVDLKPACAAEWLSYVPLTWHCHLLLCGHIYANTPVLRASNPIKSKAQEGEPQRVSGSQPFSLGSHVSPQQWPPLIRMKDTRQISCYRETHPLTAPQLYPTAPTGTSG